ncbi:hypothetical protein FAM09_24830 [Niastella caeni]|uniref:Uncharacterized protein n=1 Tax=Niastella caeni TaxID=2569763 RepID=A0A4S8HGT5_9BACT|nr:hypothetical protein [Niastella caeni]THU34247.1 hypothetical protein FAM09_24830 [Niastella caeni]
MALNADKYNEAVKAWGSTARTQLQATGTAMSITHRANSPSKGESLKKIKDKYGSDNAGFINKVIFSTINRSLIYTSAGAGKGRGGNKGSRWIDKYGSRKSTNAGSLGKAGTGGRTAKPFIDTTLNGSNGVEALADIVAIHQVDAIIENIYVK